MKGTLKTMIGIMLAAAITVILEQYFESTNLFKGKKGANVEEAKKTKSSADTPNAQIDTEPISANMEDEEEKGNIEIEPIEEETPKNVTINPLLRLDHLITLKNNQETMLWRIDNKKEPKKTTYLEKVDCPSFIPNYKNFIDIQFEFVDEEMVKVIEYLAIEGYNKTKKKWQRNFFQPRTGINKLRLPNKFKTTKKQEIRFGYILKKDTQKSAVPFYHATCSCRIE